MHKLMAPTRRSILKVYNRQHQNASPPKKTRRTTSVCYVKKTASITHRKGGRKIRKNLMHEFSENESRKGSIEDSKNRKSPMSKKISSESVIYVGTVKSQDINSNNVPVVDLTQSSSSLSSLDNNLCSKSLKTIYFPGENFERSIHLKKNLITTSLVNLPVIKKPILRRRLFSAAVISSKIHNKLSVLNISDKFLESSDFICPHPDVLIKTALTENDKKIINWILDQDCEEIDTVISHDSYSMDTGCNSLPELCDRYDVNSNSTFD